MSDACLRRVCACLSLPILLASVPAAADAAAISWRKDFRRAALESKEHQKPLLLEVTASWCGSCHKMFEQTFSQQAVADHVNACFVPVAVDADADQALVEAIGVYVLPTTIVLSPKMQILKTMTGFQTAEQLQRQLAQICGGSKPAQVTKPEPPSDPPADAPLAFGGACLTSLRDEYKHRVGSPEHAVVYNGVRLQFASAEHLEQFAADPERYWPMWDGRCIVSAVDERVERAGKPQFAVVYRGRVWFFAGKERQQVFLESAAEFPAEPDRTPRRNLGEEAAR